MLDGAAGAFESGEEGVDVGDVALGQAQFAELGEDQLVEPVRVDVAGRVRALLHDLLQPHVGRIAEARVLPQRLGALAVAAPQVVLEGTLSGSFGRAPPRNAAGDAVEVPDAAAGDPAAVLALRRDRAVVPEGEGWTGHTAPAPEEFASSKRRVDLF